MVKVARSAIVESLLVLIGASVVVFGLRYLAGDPAALYAPLEATPEQLQDIRVAFGLDRPWIVQYVDFVVSAVQGDFGNSLQSRRPALDVVLERVPATLELTIWAFVPAVVFGITLGLLAVAFRGRLVDRVVMGFSVVGLSVPIYWAGTIAILLFAVNLPLFPSGGRGGWESLVLPAITLGLPTACRISRMTRMSVAEQLALPYAVTVRAKGATQLRVLARHALPNALLPVLTLASLDLGAILGGAVVTETVFAWPGIGRLALQSIEMRDFPVVQTVVLLVALAYVFIFRGLNVLYALIDPRTRS